MAEFTGNQILKELNEKLDEGLNRREKFYLIQFLCTSLCASIGEKNGGIRTEVCYAAEQALQLGSLDRQILIKSLFEEVSCQEEG